MPISAENGQDCSPFPRHVIYGPASSGRTLPLLRGRGTAGWQERWQSLHDSPRLEVGSDLLLGEMALQVDMPELVCLPDLPQHAALFVRVLQECHQVPRRAATHSQVGDC